MLEKHCKENNPVISDEYVDDGYSGLNFKIKEINNFNYELYDMIDGIKKIKEIF